MSSHPNIIPSMRYADAPAAIEWLCRAFGFTRHLVVPGEGENEIAHAQLVLKDEIGTKSFRGMIMLGSAPKNNKDDDLGARLIQPDAAGTPDSPKSTQSVYVMVPDVDAHCAQAKSHGARVLDEPEDQHYGGRLYSCLDLEGHLWHFGSYNPWG